jgi:hypothetical protein
MAGVLGLWNRDDEVCFGSLELTVGLVFVRCVQPDTQTGDIVFVLQQKEHPKFKRKGDDLFVEHSLSLTEALCGFQFPLTHLDGRQLLIKSNAGEIVKPGTVLVIVSVLWMLWVDGVYLCSACCANSSALVTEESELAERRIPISLPDEYLIPDGEFS